MFSQQAATSEPSWAAMYRQPARLVSVHQEVKRAKADRVVTRRPTAKGKGAAMTTVCNRMSHARVAISEINFTTEPSDNATVRKYMRALTRGDLVASVFLLRVESELRADIGSCLIAAAAELGHAEVDAVIFEAASTDEADAVSALLFDLEQRGEAVCEELALIAASPAGHGSFVARLLDAAPFDACAQLATIRRAMCGAESVRVGPMDSVENGAAWFTVWGDVNGERRAASQVIPWRVCASLRKSGVSLERYQAGLVDLLCRPAIAAAA